MSLSSPSVKAIDGADFRVGIVAARFNEALVDGLLSRVIAELRRWCRSFILPEALDRRM